MPMSSNFPNVSPFGRPTASTQNKKWEAAAYINLYLPNKSGKKRKVGAIKLFAERAEEARLIEYMNQSEKHTEHVLNSLILDYQTAGIKEENEFDLPELVTSAQ